MSTAKIDYSKVDLTRKILTMWDLEVGDYYTRNNMPGVICVITDKVVNEYGPSHMTRVHIISDKLENLQHIKVLEDTARRIVVVKHDLNIQLINSVNFKS